MTPRGWSRLRVLAAVVIIAVLARRLGTEAFVDGVRPVDGEAVLAALAIGLLTTAAGAWRWWLVARRLGLPLPPGTAMADYYQAQFLNAVLPAGVLGDAHRAVRHGRRAGDLGRGVRTVLLERVGGYVVLIPAGVIALLMEPSLAGALARGLLPDPGVTAAVPAGLAVVGVPAAVWARREAIAARLRGAVAAAVADTRRGLLARDTWPGVLALSAAALLGYLALFLVAARTAGSAAPIGRLLPLLLLALLAMALPVNVGGWGPREAFCAVAFGSAGLGAGQGLTTAVTYGVLTFVASLPGAAVLLARRGAGTRETPVGEAPAEKTPVREAPVVLDAGVVRPAEDRQVVGERSH
ncbi:Uncharacterized membrane protein YbhN, UPF0104 family [Thermomonospora echinospora]|uniref:Uncharacterized membrane protein YbhN, UPF0104 family n=1 Tax=Thermomonospora echinospora TaxID=1992 RepID=A0A1H6C3Z5_9ACTN|nr:lysylphosphatidylglycerol synthase transmembrane domain-containing protein [Thermomonospora echinospora]SEG67086.1 Uncharacterized membrane protein YbhN, UPF0104 family [Thermomonospora echinospora]